MVSRTILEDFLELGYKKLTDSIIYKIYDKDIRFYVLIKSETKETEWNLKHFLTLDTYYYEPKEGIILIPYYSVLDHITHK